MAFERYKGRSIGRLMYFLYQYCIKSDECIFHGENKTPMITLWGKPFANYTWDEDTDIPTFNFLGKWKNLNKVQKNKKEIILEVIKIREGK